MDEGYRALIDCQALAKLLIEGSYEGRSYLDYAQEDSKKTYCDIKAAYSRKEFKDHTIEIDKYMRFAGMEERRKLISERDGY